MLGTTKTGAIFVLALAGVRLARVVSILTSRGVRAAPSLQPPLTEPAQLVIFPTDSSVIQLP